MNTLWSRFRSPPVISWVQLTEASIDDEMYMNEHSDRTALKVHQYRAVIVRTAGLSEQVLDMMTTKTATAMNALHCTAIPIA